MLKALEEEETITNLMPTSEFYIDELHLFVNIVVVNVEEKEVDYKDESNIKEYEGKGQEPIHRKKKKSSID